MYSTLFAQEEGEDKMDYDPAVVLLTMGFLFGVGMGFFIANVLLWGKYHGTGTDMPAQEKEDEDMWGENWKKIQDDFSKSLGKKREAEHTTED
jgi:hypothetical protein